MSTVPSLSFCRSSLSPPSWLEPYTMTFALPPSFALARRANSSAETAKSEPGSPTWPHLISVWANALQATIAKANAAARQRDWGVMVLLRSESSGYEGLRHEYTMTLHVRCITDGCKYPAQRCDGDLARGFRPRDFAFLPLRPA